jgi:hypothetical protein
MTRTEWLELATEIQARWPQREIPDASWEIWFTDLSHLPADQVRAAVLAFYVDGREWCPNGGQLLAKVSELTRDDPDYGEAWKLAKKASLKRDDLAMGWLEERSPAAAETVRRMCNPYPYLRYNLNEEGTARAQFRQMFENVVAERRRDETYAGIPGAGLRGLERGPRKLGDALKRALPERAE